MLRKAPPPRYHDSITRLTEKTRMPMFKLEAMQLSVRAALAAALAYWAATLFRSDYALYALVAAVIVTDLSPESSRKLAWQRFAGTLVGAVSGAALTYVIPVGPVALGVGILVAMLLSYVLRVGAAAKVSGYVAAIVLLAHGDDPWRYGILRAWDTALGIASALLVSFLPKLVRDRDAT